MKTRRSMAAVLAIALFVTAVPAPAAAATAFDTLQQVKSPRQLTLDQAVALIGARPARAPHASSLGPPSPFTRVRGVAVPQKLWFAMLAALGSLTIYAKLAGLGGS